MLDLHYSWNLLHNITIDVQRIYIRHSMLDHPVFFTRSFCWYGNKEGISSRHSMLHFPLFIAVSSVE